VSKLIKGVQVSKSAMTKYFEVMKF